MTESTNPTIVAREHERQQLNHDALTHAEAYAVQIRSVRKFHGPCDGPPGEPSRAMVMLVHSFPVLRDAHVSLDTGEPLTAEEALAEPTVDFDAEALYRWALGSYNEAARCAARFVLEVWNRSTIEHLDSLQRSRRKERLGRFDFTAAVAVWDRHQRAAFVAWCHDPWWP